MQHPLKVLVMNDYKKALIGLHASVFLMGASGIFAKLISTSAVFIVFGRVMFAAGALFLFLKWRGNEIKPHSGKDALFFCVLGILMAFQWFVFFHAIQISTVAIGVLTFSTFTIFTTLLEPFFFKTKIQRQDCLIALLCCIGVGIIVFPDDMQSLGNVGWGAFWGVLAGLSYAVMLLMNKAYVGRYPAITLTFYQCLVAMLVTLPIVLWMGEAQSVLPIDWVYLAVHGVICTALAFALYVYSARHIGAKTISVLTMLELLYAIILAYLVLGESLSINMLAGGVLIVTASYMATRQKRA